MATVFSYVRFSSKKQEQGDSVRRQIRAGDDWLIQHPEHVLDTSLRLRDLGVSAFRGANLEEKGALGAFIALAKKPDSPIEKGSILLIERLDRFSRQQTRKAYRAFVELVEAGVTVQTLDPPQSINEDNIDDLHVVLPLILQMTMAHEQSKEKSRRVGSVWEAKRERARAGSPMSRRRPAWLKWNEKRASFEVDPSAVAAIEYAYNRTVEGCGQRQLVTELNQRFTALGRSGKWNSSYIQKLLSDRTVLGEFQPHRFDAAGVRVATGEPIPNYYPRVISDDLFLAAAGGRAVRLKAKGPNSQFVNPFVGLLVGTDGHSLQLQTSRAKRKRGGHYIHRRLVSYGHRRGIAGVSALSVEFFAVEDMILNGLRDLDVAAVFPQSPEDHRLPAAEARVEAIRRRLSELENALLDTSNTAAPPQQIAQAIAVLEQQLAEANKVLSEERQRVAINRGHEVGQARDVISLLRSTPLNQQRDLRLRLRSVVSKMVKRICVGMQKQGRHVTPTVTLLLHSNEIRVIAKSDQTPAPSDEQSRLSALLAIEQMGQEAAIRFIESGGVLGLADVTPECAGGGVAAAPQPLRGTRKRGRPRQRSATSSAAPGVSSGSPATKS